MKKIVIFLIVIIASYAEDKIEARDSYIDAYYESRGELQSNKNDREAKYPTGYETGPEQNYGPPLHGYSEPNFPPTHYGPPVYGPPSHVPSFPSFPFPGMPHAMLGLLDKFHLKLDLFTILKILLKLVIFKKIVGFIALICLLLFIPKFKPSKEDSEDMELRSFSHKSQVDARINNLTQYVLTAIEKYSDNTNNTCEGIYCDSAKVLTDIDRKYSYDRLITMYSQDS